MENTVANSNANQVAENGETLVSFPTWIKAIIIFQALMVLLSLYMQDWKMLCVSAAGLLIFLGRKESQMSRPVKVIWAITMFGFIIAGSILVFSSLLSRGR